MKVGLFVKDNVSFDSYFPVTQFPNYKYLVRVILNDFGLINCFNIYGINRDNNFEIICNIVKTIEDGPSNGLFQQKVRDVLRFYEITEFERIGEIDERLFKEIKTYL